MQRGYVRDFPLWPAERQIELLVKAGLSKRHIYVEGSGAMTLSAIRMRRGETLGVAGGLRVLGTNRKDIVAAVGKLHAASAAILDVMTGERSDKDGVAMLDRALAKIHGEKTIKTKANARAMGAIGGKAKGRAAKRLRMAQGEARSYWFDKSIRTNTEALAMMRGWTPITAWRKFGPSGRPPGAPGKPEND